MLIDMDWFKLTGVKPYFFFSVAGAGAVVLLSPNDLSEVMGFTQITGFYRMVTGLVTTLCFFLGLAGGYPIVRDWWQLKRRWRAIRQSMWALKQNQRERLLLACCLLRDSQYFWFDSDDPAITILSRMDIIRQVQSGGINPASEYVIVSVLWDSLQKRKEAFLERTDETMLEDTRQKLSDTNQHYVNRRF
jgi:hypothetical protein